MAVGNDDVGGGVYLGEIECVASGVVGAAGEQGGIDERGIDGEGLGTVVIGEGEADFAISED